MKRFLAVIINSTNCFIRLNARALNYSLGNNLIKTWLIQNNVRFLQSESFLNNTLCKQTPSTAQTVERPSM